MTLPPGEGRPCGDRDDETAALVAGYSEDSLVLAIAGHGDDDLAGLIAADCGDEPVLPVMGSDQAGRDGPEGDSGMPADGYGTQPGGAQMGQPNIARVYDYWLGGKVNTAADRALGDELEARFPGRSRGAVENRAFLARAVGYVAGQGVRQFIDAGSGLPTVQNTHDLARAVRPDAAVVYADSDPVVVAHARKLLKGGTGLAAVEADLRDPRGLLDAAAATGVVSLAEPACAVAALVLPFFPPAEAAAVVAGLTDRLVPGSYLIVSSWCCPDPDVYAEIAAAYTAGELQNHMPETVAGWLAGLDVVPPGITDIRSWGTWLAEEELPRRPCGIIVGAVARISEPAGSR